MLDNAQDQVTYLERRASRVTVSRELFLAAVLVLEMLTVIAVAELTGMLYHAATFDGPGSFSQYLPLGLLTGILFQMLMAFQSHREAAHDPALRWETNRVTKTWVNTFLLVGMIVFLTKTGADMSRGWLVLFFVVGLGAELVFKTFVNYSLKRMVKSRRINPRRLLLVGIRADLDAYNDRSDPASNGIEVVAGVTLPDDKSRWHDKDIGLRSILQNAVKIARSQDVDDVLILSHSALSPIAAPLANPFLDLPVAIHLGRIGELAHFPGVRISKIGAEPTMTLRTSPLSAVQHLTKRAFDLATSITALIVGAPLLLMVAALIKFDSKGPVFFRQRRRGYNQVEFRIWKFRTMTTLDDGDVIEQAKIGDARVTKLGSILRRYNIDELPQLFNVVLGEMSLVGPRPHAVAHDRKYEVTIARYARRLNVRPGITGYAQIHGFRGPTETDAAMQQRVALDLEYIENWSLSFDLYILLMTMISKKSYCNAF